jgi:hypothetical protein
VPPIISVIQCTPDTILPITIKAINKIIKITVGILNALFFKYEFNLNAKVDVTEITSIVVEEG